MASRIEQHSSSLSLCRAIIVGAIAVALIVVSFDGGLDEFAHEVVAETTDETIGIYVASRTINGLVSVFQTSQIKVPLLASAEVGQMLDPVNDAVERLSSILVWAIGSLFVQRILLEVVVGPVFKWILCSIGAAMVVFVLLMEWKWFRTGCGRLLAVSNIGLDGCRDQLVRLFVLAAILRFIVPAFLTLSFMVSQMFLESEIATNTEQLLLLKTQVSDMVESKSADNVGLEAEREREEARNKEFRELKALAQVEFDRLDAQTEQFSDEAGFLRLLPESLGGVAEGEELQAVNMRLQELVTEIENIDDDIRGSDEALECIDTRIAGGSCKSLWERISNASTAGLTQLRETIGKFNEMTTSVALLLAAVAAKNLLFPIVFLIGAVKCSVPLARFVSRLLAGFQHDSRKLEATIASKIESWRTAS